MWHMAGAPPCASGSPAADTLRLSSRPRAPPLLCESLSSFFSCTWSVRVDSRAALASVRSPRCMQSPRQKQQQTVTDKDSRKSMALARWRAGHAAAAPRPADQKAPRDWQRAACPPSSPPPLYRHASHFDGGGLPLCCRHVPPPSPPPPTAIPSATPSAAAVCATAFPPDSRRRCHGRRRWRRPLAVLL